MPPIPSLEFANKLRNAMAERKMSASDLARAIWGDTTDSRGYKVAKNRDRIGAYLAGTGYPSKETLRKLCEVLGWSMADVPPATRSTAPRALAGASDFTFSMLADQPKLCSLYIRKILPTEVGLKIVHLVTESERV